MGDAVTTLAGRRQVREVVAGLSALALGFALLVVAAQPADASFPLGCQFPPTSAADLKWKPYITDSSYSSVASSSVSAWNSAGTPVTITQVSSGANIGVADGNFGNVEFDGITQDGNGNAPPACGGSGFWAGGVFTWWNRYFTNSYSTAKRKSVMVHELGHALGLAHNQAYTCANMPIMKYDTATRYDTCGITTPNTDDINGVTGLY
jgi:hypothetical protein